MKILVTGAAGFIGSHLMVKLRDKGFAVTGIDNFSSYYSIAYKKLRLDSMGLSEGNVVKECDFSNFTQLNNLIADAQPNYIVHLGAQAGVRIGIEDFGLYIDSNIIGFQNVIRASHLNGVEGIIYSSSSSVYGDLSPIPYREDSMLLKPKSFYGVTKLANELFAQVQSESTQLKLRGLRLFTVYGPWGRPDMSYFRLAAAALGQHQFQLNGDGSIKRDFTFIDDVTNYTTQLLEDLAIRDEGFCDLVNIGGGVPHDMSSIIRMFEEKASTVINIDRLSRNKVDAISTMADNSYLERLLGKTEFTSLESGVESVLEWASSSEILPSLRNWIRSTI